MTITRPVAMALLFSLSPIAAAPPAFAQAAAEDPTTAMARARFKEGVDFYDKGEYEQARASFLQAYALKKHPTVLLNLAWSCLRSGRPLDAERYFKQFLGEGKDITDKQRADANDGLTQSRAKLGRIEIVAGTGTDVTVDGERLGPAPIADPVMVEAGAHTIKFRGADGLSETQSITVMGGEKAVARYKSTLPGPAPTSIPPASVEPSARPAPASPSTSPSSATAEEPARGALQAPHSSTEPAPSAEEGKSVFAAPKNWAPVVILGVGAVAAYGTAAAMYVFKQSAQDKANSIATAVNMAGGGCGAHPDACAAHDTDVSNVNDDATVGNVALGIGVAATVGAIVYWLASTKEGDARTTGSAGPALLPILGPGTGGAAIAGRF